jgi:SAM-dependent methyltransferase
MNARLRRLVVAPIAMMPGSLRRKLVQTLAFAAAAQPPREALRELLTIESGVSGQIDLAAMAYGNGVHVKHRLMRYHDFFVERISGGERVLDIGCGYGAVANSIATRTGAWVVGLDMVQDNVDKARRLFTHDRLSFTCGEAPQTLPDGSFDVIVMSNVLEHIDARVAFLRAVQQKMAPSRWLIRVPMFNRDWHPPLRQEVGLFPYGDPTHHTEYTVESFAQEMADAGFTIRHLQVNWGEIWSEVAPA